MTINVINSTLINKDDIVIELLKFLRVYNPSKIIDRYHLSNNIWENKTDIDVLLEITKKLGFKNDYDRAAERILLDLRKGKLDNFTLETPKDIEEMSKDV